MMLSTVASAATAGTVSISSDSMNLGESAQVTISIANSVNVTGMDLTLVYNPSIVSLSSVSTDTSVVSGHTVDYADTGGTVTISLRQLNALTNAGSVPVISLSFNSVASGSSALDLQNVLILGTDGTSSPGTTSDGSITVTSTDSAPVLAAIGDKSVNEGELLTFTISATDPDGDAVTYSANNLPTGANFNTGSGYFRWRPDSGTAGNYQVEFIATANGLTDSETITITVVGPDQAPVLNSIGNKDAVVNHPLTFTISATDPDGDAVSYSASDLPSGATLNSNTGAFSWTPSSVGNYYIDFTATANGLTDSERVRITVGTDSAPVLASIGDKSGNEGELLSFTVSATDPNGDTPTYSAVGLPSGATLDSNTGAFRWTPGYDAAGTYNVEFVATSYGLTDSETITITINDVDRPPVLNPINDKTVAENELLSFSISATDPDDANAVITYSASGLPEGATFNSAEATFSWTPGYDDAGNYDVVFTATSNGLSASETIIITVGDYNRPPVLSAIGSKSVEEEDDLKITLSATDPDSGTLTYSAENLPDNATFNESTAVFRWTPEDGEEGTYYVIFSVSDGQLTDSENVTITVTEPSTSSSSGGGGSSSSSSSSGGGASVSSEEYENIALKDYVLKTSVLRDTDVVFSFEKPGNSITSVCFTPNVNGGQAKAVVEMLQGTSSQVGSAAPGDVYTNMNIYLDTALVTSAIEDITISFKVEKNWVIQNNINISNIVLCRYSSSSWEQLPTEMTEDDSGYYYFTSETPGFSSFAITSIDPNQLASEYVRNTVSIPQSEEGGLGSTVDSLEELESAASQKSTSAVGFVFILILAGIGIVYWAIRME